MRKQRLETQKIVWRFPLKGWLWCCESSPPEVCLGKGVLRTCSKFTGEQPCRSAISIKLQSKFNPQWKWDKNLQEFQWQQVRW